VTDIIFTMDMNLHYTYVSPSAYRIAGYDAMELTNMKIDAMVDPETLNRFYRHPQGGAGNRKTTLPGSEKIANAGISAYPPGRITIVGGNYPQFSPG